jgi:hypothetical protein
MSRSSNRPPSTTQSSLSVPTSNETRRVKWRLQRRRARRHDTPAGPQPCQPLPQRAPRHHHRRAPSTNRHTHGKCFKCDELSTPNHCKQLFTIEVVDEEVNGLSPMTEEPTISLHALTGIQPHDGAHGRRQRHLAHRPPRLRLHPQLHRQRHGVSGMCHPC